MKKVDITCKDEKAADYIPALIHCRKDLKAVIGDQSEYQRRFLETVNQSKDLMLARKPGTSCFTACLECIAQQRYEMAVEPCRIIGQPNRFGVRRFLRGSQKYYGGDCFHTVIYGPYKKYLETFLQSDKAGWNKKISFGSLIYSLHITLPSSDTPIETTSIYIDSTTENSDGEYVFGPEATWEHTPIKNFEPALKEAERLFNLVLQLPVTRDTIGLETIMRGVGEVHWWVASTCPFQRGSAAIAKMMGCALLKYHGIEAGGFGDIEPDCMALIQTPSAFAANYSSLMRLPSPHWVVA
jgi:hypothetical protein